MSSKLQSGKSRILSTQEIGDHAILLERAESIAKLGHWRLYFEEETLFWSNEVYRIHGVTPETYTPKLESAVFFYHPDDRERVGEIITQTIIAQTDFTFEARILRPSGEVRHVRASGECAVDENGEVKALIGVFQDITEQVKAYDEVKKNHEFLTLVMESIPDLLFVKDEDFRIVRANSAFLNTYPESIRPQIIGSTTLEAYDEAEADAFLEFDKQAFREGYSETEETIVFPDGIQRTLLTKKVRFEDSDQKAFILALARDISKLNRTNEALIEANTELEEFAYRTSHDLRSPLVSSLRLLGMIRKALESNNLARVHQSIDHIEGSLIRLERLVNDILDLAKVKNTEDDAQVINLEALVDEAISSFSHMQNVERLTFIKNFEFTNDLVLMRTRLSLIIENLISNAIKYQDLNEASSYVKISTLEKKQSFVLEVEDNGLGIPEEQHAKVFQMFKRFHNKVAFGSGLGLYMMKKSAEALGGDLNFEPLEKGTRFILEIPLGRT